MIDGILNRVTMYRLLVYVLGAWLGIAVVFGWLGMIHLPGTAILASTLVLLGSCWAANALWSRVFGAPAHALSAVITALILALIVPPTVTPSGLFSLVWLSAIAMTGKFLVVWQRQHLFNPAALAVAVSSVTIGLSATWWVSNTVLLPFVLIGGWLVIRKVQAETMVGVFLASAFLSTTIVVVATSAALLTTWHELLVSSPLIFFAAIMLTEPTTMPARRRWRLVYAALIGVLSTPMIHLFGIATTPELALLLGNFFTFLVLSRRRFQWRLEAIEPLTESVKDFVFVSEPPLQFIPGQYVELTVPHRRVDRRGRRRYFTIASAPSESTVRIGVKFAEPSSSFKHGLADLQPGDSVVASQVGGDFVLPNAASEKLLLIAGGIGITPFRSILSDLLARRERRDIVVLNAIRQPSELVYESVLASAVRRLGVRVVTIASENDGQVKPWSGTTGQIDEQFLRTAVPDYAERRVFISGSHGFVSSMKHLVRRLGVPRRHIVADFFPGLA